MSAKIRNSSNHNKGGNQGKSHKHNPAQHPSGFTRNSTNEKAVNNPVPGKGGKNK